MAKKQTDETRDYQQAKLRVEELRSQIAYHEHRYFVLDEPGDLRRRIRQAHG